MELNCTVTTTQDLCMELKTYFTDLHALPYNRFNRNNTVWWLSPGSAIPAYRFPKFAVLPPEAEMPDQLFVGIYIEKGVSEAYAKTVGYTKPLILRPDWAWHGLLADMERGDKLARSIAQVRNNAGRDLELRLYASMQIKDVAEGLAPKGEQLVFDVADGLIPRQSSTPVQLLSSLAKCSSLAEFALGLNNLEKSGFIWIDLVLGVPFTMKDDGKWSAENIAKKVLAPFEWLVQS